MLRRQPEHRLIRPRHIFGGSNFFSVLLLIVCAAVSLAFATDRSLTQLIHKSWQTEHGLPQNAVYSLAQDHDGFLWIGTENGLVRFDGVRFEVFTETSALPVPHNFASSLLAAKDGTVWAGTRTGGLWRFRDGRFEIPFSELATREVLAIGATPDGAVWVGTDRGLYRIHGESAVLMNFPGDSVSSAVTALAAGQTGELWAGTRQGELLRVGGSEVTLALSADVAVAGAAIKALAYDSSSAGLWIARDGAGLQLFRTNTLTQIDLFPQRSLEYLQALHLDSDGTLWIGSQSDGVIRYSQGVISVFGHEEGLPDSDVRSLFRDREGSLWIGTLFGGLNRLLAGKAVTFSKPEGLPVPGVTCVVPAKEGSLWIGTTGGGLFKFQNSKFLEVDLGAASETPARDIRALYQDTAGNLWIGTHGAGLIRYSADRQVRYFSTKEGLSEDFVSAIFERGNGELWIGAVHNGITIYNPTSGAFQAAPGPEFLRTHIRALAEDSTGTVWIGTQKGLVRFSNGSFAEVKIPEVPELSVRHLLWESPDTLWIASRDNGLLQLKAGKVRHFNAAMDLRHNRIYQILPTSEDLWLAGNEGIERVGRVDLALAQNHPGHHLATQLFTRNEGLRTSECGGDFSPSVARDADGILWFGTREGLVRIDPRQNGKVRQPPNVLITSIRADSVHVDPKHFTGLKPGTTRMQIDYTALSLRNPATVYFKYKLEKVDATWVDAGRSREAVYYNLEPGPYQFRVVACNDEGVWNNRGATLAFTVAPQFYQTAWFRGLAALGIFSGLASAYRARLKTIRSRNRVLETLVTRRTSELQSEVEQRRDAEQRLRVLNEELETRVKVRTLELRNANENLEIELRERHQAEHALARSEARLRRIVDSGMVGILFWHRDGGISDANNTFLEMIGYTREELEQGLISWHQLTPPEFNSADEAALGEIARTGVCSPFEKEYIHKNGKRIPVLLGGASLSADGEKGVCFVLDISRRKESEEEIRQLNLLLEARVQERTTELARANEQLASEVQERKRVVVALAAFSHLGQKLHSARTEKEAAMIVAETARSLIPHENCSIDLYGNDGQLGSVLNAVNGPTGGQTKSRCEISVSIRNGSRVVGILGLQSSSLDGFTFEDANTLQALGDYCGGALERIHAEEARRETERRFSTFMTNAPALAWMKDANFRYAFTNEAFQRFIGFDSSQIEGRTDYELWPENVASQIRANDAETVATQAKRETHERLKRSDGEARTLLTLRFLFTTGTGEQYVAGMAVDVTEQKRAEEALHRLPQSIIEAQEAERRRVARELHDGVNQAIASIKFRIQTAEQQIIRADPKWQDTCSKTKDMLDAVLQQVRRLSRNLRPGELDDFGLVPAARSACQEMELRTGVCVKFAHSEFNDRLPPTLELSLYRIIQEALTNVEKHSGATEVAIDLQEDGAHVVLEISDNGCGFESNKQPGSGAGLGLLHMRERASLVGGQFSFHSSPGQGVRINIHVPLKRSSDSNE